MGHVVILGAHTSQSAMCEHGSVICDRCITMQTTHRHWIMKASSCCWSALLRSFARDSPVHFQSIDGVNFLFPSLGRVLPRLDGDQCVDGLDVLDGLDGIRFDRRHGASLHGSVKGT